MKLTRDSIAQVAIHKILKWSGEKCPAMDVSYSAWRHSTEDKLALKGDSFSFLFDRRYTNRLNRMSRVFFEAYARATKELSAQEDRFPSLSEIDAKMESGAVYAFKDRLTKNTEFFEEIKISGVSYLVPRAKRFVDSSGIYTELAFNFDEGTVILPTRRKIPSQVDLETPETDMAEEEAEAEAAIEEMPIEKNETSAAKAVAEEKESSVEKELLASTLGTVQPYQSYTPEPFLDIDEPSQVGVKADEEKKKLPSSDEHSAAVAPPAGIKQQQPPKKESLLGSKARIAAIGLLVMIVIIAAGAYFIGLSPPTSSPKLVYYTSSLSNASQGNYLGLDIKNQNGINDEIEMMLPPNIDKSISSRGGVITISHAGNTSIRLNSSTDASVRLYLSGNWTAVPVTLSMAVPKGYDSGLVVHGKDYNVNRRDDKIVLRFNCTREGVSFEQSYSPKR